MPGCCGVGPGEKGKQKIFYIEIASDGDVIIRAGSETTSPLRSP